MITDFSLTTIKRGDHEMLDDYVAKVLRSVDVPVCINTVAVLTGLAPHRVCKILNRLERDKRIRKITNVYHAYWQLI
jgi:hypothetical protein